MIRRLIILLLIVGCEEPSQHGCLDSQACNYDTDATIDNNSCIYELDCEGVCGGNDTSCMGCTVPYATNYNSSATVFDNSCQYSITFKNITIHNIEIYFNSDMVDDFTLSAYSTNTKTYECSEFDCSVSISYNFNCNYCNDICVCSEGYEYNQSYTFG